MGRRQTQKVVNGITNPTIRDDSFAKSDHIPFYRDFPGNYSWIKSCAGKNQVVTRGSEKERYTVHFTCLKSGRKLPPFIIFKGAYPPPNKNPRINTVVYEIKHHISDNAGNQYPPNNDMYTTCSKTENSN